MKRMLSDFLSLLFGPKEGEDKESTWGEIILGIGGLILLLIIGIIVT
jgi:hypothetical protein